MRVRKHLKNVYACTVCQGTVEEDETFCKHCGTRLVEPTKETWINWEPDGTVPDPADGNFKPLCIVEWNDDSTPTISTRFRVQQNRTNITRWAYYPKGGSNE